MNLTEEKNLTGAVLLIDRGFPGYLFVVMYWLSLSKLVQ